MRKLLDSPDAPLETGLFTCKFVAYAGEGWESQAPVPPHQHAHIPISDRHGHIFNMRQRGVCQQPGKQRKTSKSFYKDERSRVWATPRLVVLQGASIRVVMIWIGTSTIEYNHLISVTLSDSISKTAAQSNLSISRESKPPSKKPSRRPDPTISGNKIHKEAIRKAASIRA